MASRFKYNGKELSDELGYNTYDYTARHYDPAIGRWLQLDPMAEIMTRHSPYNYAFNNPVYYIDPDGNIPIDPKKIWRAITQPSRILKRFRAYSQGVKDGMSSELQYDTFRQAGNENKTPGKTHVAEADYYEYNSGYDAGKFVQRAMEFIAGSGGPSNIRKGVSAVKNLLKTKTDDVATKGFGVLSGRRTAINANMDDATKRSLMRENESADILTQHGYNVEQNPLVSGSRNPDYKIDGEIFDNYAPETANVRNIWSTVSEKVSSGQTNRVVLNVSDFTGNLDDLIKQFNDWNIEGLEKLIIIGTPK